MRDHADRQQDRDRCGLGCGTRLLFLPDRRLPGAGDERSDCRSVRCSRRPGLHRGRHHGGGDAAGDRRPHGGAADRGAGTVAAGDLAPGALRRAGGAPREVPVGLVAPIAEQVLAGDLVAGRTPAGAAEHLGRACAEYRFALIGEDEGRPFRSDVRLLVWEGLVLVREVRDADLDDLRAVAEVVELDRD